MKNDDFLLKNAINSGNSGGAVFNEDLEICGVAFAGMDSGQSIGYVIPVSVIRLFLRYSK